jgi:hypothetical protein
VARLLLIAVLVLTALPATASAHAVVSSDSGRISWRSADPDSPSTLRVTVQGDLVRFADPTEHGGMSTGPGCDPGAVDGEGFIREVTCSRSGVTELFVDLDGGDDQATIDVPLAVTASGRVGNDRITTSAADDTLFGGEGNDVLEPGAGSDVVQGEAGDDELKVRDGVADQVVCGEGNDLAETDDRDPVAVDAGCERVNGAPAGGDGGIPRPRTGDPDADRVPPRIELPGSRSMRARGGRFTLRVGVDEPARLTASGTLRVGGRSFRVITARATATAPGVRRLTVRLPARARAALRRARRGTVRLSIGARDGAGNRARRSIRLRLRD